MTPPLLLHPGNVSFVERVVNELLIGSIGRRTPLSVFAAREKAQPTPPAMRLDGRRLRFDKIDGGGSVTIRHRGKLHHIGVGRPYAGWRVVMLVDGRNIEIVALDGSPLRRLVLDPAVDYQRAP